MDAINDLHNGKTVDVKLVDHDSNDYVFVSGNNQNRSFVSFWRYTDGACAFVVDYMQTGDVALNVGGVTTEYGMPEAAVPQEMVVEALLYFLREQGLSPELDWEWESQ